MLMGMMSYISVWAMSVFDGTGLGGARFTGTEQQKLLIMGLFGSLILFGFVCFAAGLWQLILGRRNKIFVWAVVGLAILVAIGGGSTVWLIDR
jgi:hypothetical protein